MGLCFLSVHFFSINVTVCIPFSSAPKVFKGIPLLPTYEDATKRGMYCIIRDSDITAPPAYQARIPDSVDNSNSCDANADGETDSGAAPSAHLDDVFPLISTWDFAFYGVHRGSINSMPELSSIYAPPESPYPGDVCYLLPVSYFTKEDYDFATRCGLCTIKSSFCNAG